MKFKLGLTYWQTNTLKSSQTQKLQYNILESTQEGGESCDTEKIR